MSLSEKKTTSRKHTVHFLSNPVKLKWPVISNSEEEHIQTQLHSIFDKYKECLRTVRKPRPWQKNTSTDPNATLGLDMEQQRKTFKSWMVVGLQQVIKCLERDRLRLVLVARDLQPAVLKSTLLQLVNERGVPAVCVGGMHATVVKSWTGLSSLAALGVMKTEVPNDFDSLVKFVKENAPPIDHAPEMAAMSEPGHETSNACEGKEVKQTDSTETLLEKSIVSNDTKIVEHIGNKCSENRNALPSTNDTASLQFDLSKYYVYKSETKNEFSGQTFIQLGAEDNVTVITEVEEIVNGRRQTTATEDKEQVCTKYGISPASFAKPVCQNSDMTLGKTDNEITKRKTKRKHGELMGSSYRAVNVEQRTEKSSEKKKNKKLKKK